MLYLRKAQEVFMYFVYRIDNTLNGKMYFGYTNADPSTFTFEQLLNFAHDNADLKHLYNSMKKYGEKAFKVTRVNYHDTKADAIWSEMSKINYFETTKASKGYNCNEAELIPCCACIEEKPTTTIAEKDPIDVINAATESLTKMRGCIRAKDFTKFFAEYVYFNSIIYVTGVYDHFGLAMDGMAGTLFEICRDCLSVYIKEHLKIR